MTLRERVDKIVTEFPTKHEAGFMPDELETIIDMFPNLNMKYWDNAMIGNTCAVIEGKPCIYHIDVYHALLAGLEDRELTVGEWD